MSVNEIATKRCANYVTLDVIFSCRRTMKPPHVYILGAEVTISLDNNTEIET